MIYSVVIVIREYSTFSTNTLVFFLIEVFEAQPAEVMATAAVHMVTARDLFHVGVAFWALFPV